MAEFFVIEDNLQHSRRIQQLVLRTGDHRIESFVDARQAVEEMQKRLDRRDRMPDVMILDLNLPESSGHEILRYCKQSGACKLTRIMILSQRLTEEQCSICKLMGALVCIEKNSSDDAIEKAIAGLLDPDEFEQAS